MGYSGAALLIVRARSFDAVNFLHTVIITG